jgi:hypothetical protein
MGALSPISALATEAPTWLCVPETAGSTVTADGSKGECAAKTTSVELPPTAELATLRGILPYINYVESGIGGKPTIQFDAANVQIVSGTGSTGITNGRGNLVIGYDENGGKHEQTGSHNLILGEEQTFTSYGDILGGGKNVGNSQSSIVGGRENTTNGPYASAIGGTGNIASGEGSTIDGGRENVTTVAWASTSGGYKNEVKSNYGWIGGGYKNKVNSIAASIFGGKELITEKEYEAIP